MRIIYCDNVSDSKVIEPDYKEERRSSSNSGWGSSLISFEDLETGAIKKALKHVKYTPSEELAIYRGWMLKPAHYKNLYDGLLEKNVRLINSPTEYKHCHYLPESYDKIEAKTPRSKWTTELETTALQKLASDFGESPIIVKDFVKSEKHNWKEACFIPNASDKNKVKAVTENFIKLRGEWLNEGIVFRKYEELEFLAEHSKSGMPLTKEFRVFFANKKATAIFEYWDEGEYGNSKPPLDEFIEIAQSIESNFFTMDIAQKKNGEWIIMELGDGQVAGLPDNADNDNFYLKIYQNVLEQ